MSRSAKLKLAETIASFAFDPFSYSLFAFPWDTPGTALEGLKGPRRWQRETLREIGDHLANPDTRFQPLRIAIASGHGAGKSALISMIVSWALATCPDTRVVVTANTEGQLLTKTMPELIKWCSASITRHWFKTSAMSIASTEKGRAHSWRLDAIPWSTHSPEAFAGLHNAGRRIVLIFDEASNIADRIWEVAEGALTDEATEIIWVCVGNPTRNSGRFKECFGKSRNRWSTRHIDSRTVEGTNLEYLNGMVADYGEDSDFVKVRVRGLFPSQSSMSFIGSDAVDAARNLVLPNDPLLPSDPVIFGLDHARFGDDSTVLAIRQGRDARSRPWRTWTGATSMEIASGLMEAAAQYFPDAIFIDAGGPNAGGVIDRTRQLMGDEADRVFEINFGNSHKQMEARWQGDTRVRVANKRAQMWTNMRAWLERGALPDEQRLSDDLTGVEYGYNADNAVQLEKKEHMRSRGLASPDWGDALALTFAEDVMPRRPEFLNPDNYRPAQPYDRYRDLEVFGGARSGRESDYDRYAE
jgi:hypothetical protein